MKKKGLLLFLTIGLPVVIFLFLKGFGENKFEIPVYYQEGLTDSLSTPCLDRSKQQYVVNSNLINSGKINIIHFERLDGPVLKTRLEELERLQDVFYDDNTVQLSTFTNTNSLDVQAIQDYEQRINFVDQFWTKQGLDSLEWAKLKFCDLAMSQLDNRVVLIDKQNRIRGYYNIVERDETDRLILELRILRTEEE